MRTVLGIAAACLLLVVASPSSTAASGGSRGHHPPSWQPVGVDTTQQFRGLDATDRRHAWVSGSAGGVWKTSDGGRTWTDVSPPEAAGLLLRDVEILKPGHVLVMAIGENDDSRIFRTTDGGRTWTQPFVNDDPAAFYDCMAMWPGGKRGVAMSDPVDGKFRIIETSDGGASWSVVDPAGMPDAVAGEFGFAASGTCLVTAGGRDVWLGSGGAASRVFHSRDRGHTWTVTDSTIPAADAGGVFSLAFRNVRTGLAVGGDFTVPDNGVDMSAYSRDGGRSWTNGGDLGGYRSGADWLAGSRATAVAVGPTGSDITHDGGRHWTSFDDTAYDAVQCVSDGSCWASGPAGAVARLRR
jgi:photosystem II stability/assembly factor-like uncharacterized protein